MNWRERWEKSQMRDTAVQISLLTAEEFSRKAWTELDTWFRGSK